MTELVRLGRRVLRLPRPPEASAAALVAAGRALPGVVDVVVGDRHVALHYAGDAPTVAPTLELTGHTDAPAHHELVVRYDGEDLAALAAALQMEPHELVARHVAPAYEVAFLGFLPGFAYLTGLDPRLVVPRRDTPRTRVPAGAVAIGGPYTGVYPHPSPGGWHLVGTLVSVPLWDSERGPVLGPGDRVRFREVGP